ncbi:MAG: hypothetical protein IKX22_12290 [Prevotella sp.]|nr:hypothetical protein [Prevotella sp.]
MKTYIAKSHICINVMMPEGVRHVRFIPCTLGNSYLMTDDPILQMALESHPRYGTLFIENPPRPSPREGVLR